MKEYCDRMMEKNGSPKGAQDKTATKIMLIQIQRSLVLQEAEGPEKIKPLINNQHRVVVKQVCPAHIFLEK